MPIELSVRGGLMRHCDPRWLNVLRCGVWFVVASILLALPAAYYHFVMATDSPFFRAKSVSFGFEYAMFFHSDVCLFVGAAMLTASGRYDALRKRRRFARKLLCLPLLVAICTYAGSIRTAMGPSANLTFSLIGFWWVLNIVGVHAILLTYLRRVAVLVPDLDLVERPKWLARLIGLGFPALWLILGDFNTNFRHLSGNAAQEQGQLVVTALMIALSGLAAVVFGVVYPMTLAKFERHFSIAAMEARHEATAHDYSWSAPDEP
jgi:hypothetical protein